MGASYGPSGTSCLPASRLVRSKYRQAKLRKPLKPCAASGRDDLNDEDYRYEPQKIIQRCKSKGNRATN